MGKSNTIILIADDEPSVLDTVRAIIQRQGYGVLLAADGEEALKLSRNHVGDIDVLITDMKMPGMDGLALTKSIVIERPQIRVMLMSGLVSAELRWADMKLPFLRKPFRPAGMYEKLDETIAGPPAKELLL